MSGGERKRASIGYDLIAQPRVLFLDEPTSGLDSQNAFQLLKYIKRVAQETNCLVVCSIHQPSSRILELIDRVICLADGKQIYNGPCYGHLKDYLASNF